MKKITLALLSFLLLGSLSACSNNDHPRPIIDNEVYDVPIPTRDVAIKEIKMLNVPTSDVEIGYISYMGIEVSIDYVDGVNATIPFTERLLTKDSYDSLVTPGKKTIDFLFQGNHVYFDVNLVEAEVPVYHKVSYYDHYNNLLAESYHHYLSSAVYNGPKVQSFYQGDYYYEFSGKWDHDMNYVYCDFEAHAIYDQLNVRNRGLKYTEAYDVYYEDEGTYRTVDAVPLVSEYNPDGYLINNYALFYLGELENVEILSGETFYHKQGDFDVILGDANLDSIVWDDIVSGVVNNGFRVGDKYKSSAHPFFEYLAWIEDPLWLKINPSKSYYGMPKGIAYKINDDFPSKTYTRKDGRNVSFSSIINDDVMGQIKDNIKATNYQLYTSADYPTGYYKVSYVVDIDLSLQTMFIGMADESTYELLLNPQNSELIPGYVPSSLRAVLTYSENGSFKEQKSSPISFDVNDLLSYFGMPAK